MTLDAKIESIFGLDLGFDSDLLGTKDVVEESTAVDFQYRRGLIALKEEIERLFQTPKGSFVDDPTYGIDLSLIGTAIIDLRVTLGMARVAVLDALSHPSFESRFQVAELEVDWSAATPNAVYVYGLLEVFGFSGALWEFGPYAVELLNQ